MAENIAGPRTTKGGRDVMITRTFESPIENVWRAWTDPAQLSSWWGPEGFTSPRNRIDLRVGGRYVSSMRSPDGKEIYSTGVYKEIVPNRKLVMTDSFSDREGNVVPPTTYGMSSSFPRELTITVTFEETDEGTKVTLRHSGVENLSETDRTNMEDGWEQSFDKLDNCLSEHTFFMADPDKPELIISREFDAPRDLVYKAYTDPKLIPQWWGPERLKTTVERMDVKPGGAWRIVQKDPEGKEFSFSGKFKELVPSQRIVQSFNYEQVGPGHEVTETVTFEEKGGKTKMVDTSIYRTVEDRDMNMEMGMEEGLTESMDRLDGLLRRIRKGRTM